MLHSVFGNEYLVTREYRDRNTACDRFIEKIQNFDSGIPNRKCHEFLILIPENQNVFILAVFISATLLLKSLDLNFGFRIIGAEQNA